MKKTVTLVVPLYNEEHRVQRLLSVLEKVNISDELQLVAVRFVDDGSTDGTVSVLKSWKDRVSTKVDYSVEILSYDKNMGRGYALRMGLRDVSSDYGAYIDADMDIPLANISGMVGYMNRGIDVIMGSKKRPGSICTADRKIHRMMMGYGHSALAGLILGKFYWDYQGGFKVFSKRVLENVLPILSIDKWGFDMEVVHWAEKLGFSVVETPLTWGAVTEDSKVSAIEDSARAVSDMLSIRKRSVLWSLEQSKLPKTAKVGVRTLIGVVTTALSLGMLVMKGVYEA